MFDIKARGSTPTREVLGGITTFMAMSYIIFVQIGLLGGLGEFEQKMDAGGVMMATCIAAAAATILMGLLANYPIALAPGMGENFFFALILTPAIARWGLGMDWQVSLALTGCVGVIFLFLSFVGVRSAVLNSIPDALKSGIAAGIGLFIAVIGFNYGNLVAKAPGAGLIEFPGFTDNPVAWLTLIGLGVTLALLAFRLRGAILLGILITTGVALGMGHLGRWLGPDNALGRVAAAMGLVEWCGSPVAMPGGMEKTFAGFVQGFGGLWQALWSKHALELLTYAFVLLFMDLFDTVGTLVGVASRAGLMIGGRLPKAERALAADAAGTVMGAAMGTSTVTSYIESITGVTAGARTGLAAVVTGVLLAAAVFFKPVAAMVGGGVNVAAEGAEPLFKYPLIAPALIIVGAMMLRTFREIEWDDATEYVPAFLTMMTMPLAYSISAGIAIGFVSYAFGKLVTGRAKQCPLMVYIFAVLFVLRYVVAPQ